MKNLFLLAAMLLVTVSAFCHNYQETVYLKNGIVIENAFVEFQPDKSVKMKTSDDCIISFDYDDIDKITREQKSETNSEFSKKYRGFVSSDFFVSNFIGVRLSTTHGVQLNPKMFLGAGVGICVGEDWKESHRSFPVYGNYRVDFLDKKISPFVDMRAGADICKNRDGKAGFYGDLSVGCRFKRCSLSAGLETFKGSCFEFQQETNYYYDEIGNEKYDVEYNWIDVGSQFLNFVTRFSFEF